MSAYTSQSYGLALEEPSEGRTAAKAFKDNFQAQGYQNPLRLSNTPKTELFASPQAKTNVHSEYESLSLKTTPSYLEKSPIVNNYPTAPITENKLARTETSPARMLISEVDMILMKSQSPNKQQERVIEKPAPLRYSQQLNFQSYGINPTSAVSLPLNSERSQFRGDISNTPSAALKQNMAFGSESVPVKSYTLLDNFTKEPQAYQKMDTYKKMETNLYPIKESPYASLVSISEKKHPETRKLASDMDDIRDRLSTLENQLNLIESQKTSGLACKDPYLAPTHQSTQALPRDNFFAGSSHKLQKSPSYGSYGAQANPLSYNDKLNTHPETTSKLGDEIFRKVSTDLDDILRNSKNNSRPLSRASSTNALRNSGYRPSIEAYRQSTPYNPSGTYDDRPTFGANSNYVTPQKHESYTNLDALPRYESQYSYKPYETLPGESELRNTPYASGYQPRYSDYENGSQTRPRYIRPLLRKSQQGGDFRPNLNSLSSKMYTSVYDSPNYNHGHTKGANSISSTPVYHTSGSGDNNSVDKKMKKLTLKSKPSEEEGSRLNFSRKQTLRRNNFRSGDLVSDHESFEVEDGSLPSMTFSETYPQNKRSETKNVKASLTNGPRTTLNNNNKLRSLNYNAGELLNDVEDDANSQSRGSQYFRAGELLDDNEEYQHQPSKQSTTQQQKTFKATSTITNEMSQTRKKNTMRSSQDYRAGNLEADHDGDEEVSTDKRNKIYRAGSLEADNGLSVDDLELSDSNKHEQYNAGELQDDESHVEEWREREQDLEKEARERRERMKEKAAGYEKEKEREKIREQERQKHQKDLDRIKNRISRNAPDDGKAWNMVFPVPSQLFDGNESSFHFSTVQQSDRQHYQSGAGQQAVRATQPAKTKDFAQPMQSPQKNAIWSIDNPMISSQSSHKRSVSNYGDSNGKFQGKSTVNYNNYDRASGFGY